MQVTSKNRFFPLFYQQRVVVTQVVTPEGVLRPKGSKHSSLNQVCAFSTILGLLRAPSYRRRSSTLKKAAYSAFSAYLAHPMAPLFISPMASVRRVVSGTCATPACCRQWRSRGHMNHGDIAVAIVSWPTPRGWSQRHLVAEFRRVAAARRRGDRDWLPGTLTKTASDKRSSVLVDSLVPACFSASVCDVGGLDCDWLVAVPFEAFALHAPKICISSGHSYSARI